MNREYEEIRAMRERLSALRTGGETLEMRLAALEDACRKGTWLERAQVEEAAGALEQLQRGQEEFLRWAGQAWPSSPAATMGEMEELLAGQEKALARHALLEETCGGFLRLTTDNDQLREPLQERQEALRAALEGDDPALERWTAGCRALLEQVERPDYGRAGELQSYQDLFGFALMMGAVGGALHQEKEEAEVVPPVPAAEGQAEGAEADLSAQEAPEIEEQAPLEEPQEPEEVPAAQAETEREAELVWPGEELPGAEEHPQLAGEKRFQAAGSKKTLDLFKRTEFRQLYRALYKRRVLSRAGCAREELTESSLNFAVREGYLTRMTTADGAYYQASPKLLEAVGKQSVQHYLQTRHLPRLRPGFAESQVTRGLLRQVDGVETVLGWLFDEERLADWSPVQGCDVSGGVRYECVAIFEQEKIPGLLAAWNLFVLADPGSAHRAGLLREVERLLTSRQKLEGIGVDGRIPEAWAVVPTQAEISRWQTYFTGREIPLPRWLALDALGMWFTPQGEARQLLDYFIALEDEALAGTEEEQKTIREALEKLAAEPPEQRKSEEGEAPEPESETAEVAAGEPEIPLEEPEEPEPESPEGPADACTPEELEVPVLKLEERLPAEPERPFVEETEKHGQEELQAAAPGPGGWERQGLFHVAADGEALRRRSAQWCSEAEFPAGLCLLRAGRSLDSGLEPLYLQYAYALDDPAEGCAYQPDRLSRIYSGQSGGAEGEALDCLSLSAHLRMAFTAGAGQSWYQSAAQLQNAAGEETLERAPSLRAALDLLARALRERRRGFEPQLIRQCQMWGETNQKMGELAQKAREIRSGRFFRVDVYTNRIKGLFEALFGTQSDLMECLGIVEQNDTGRRDRVRELCQPLLDELGSPDQRAIIKRIDQVWEEQPTKYKQKDSLKGKVRNPAISRFRTCLEVCAQWLESSDAAAIGEEEAGQILQERSRLLELFASSREETSALGGREDTAHSGAVMVLDFTLRELSDCLEGRPVDRREFYVDFLRTGQVELSEELLPIFEPAEYMIPGCEPWTRLEEHVRRLRAGEGTAWEQVVDRIWGGEKGAPDSYNFGTAQLIEDCAHRRGQKLEQLERADILGDNAKKQGWVAEQESRFRARLELAATYGQIEDNAQKERLANAITQVERLHYEETMNWGFYVRAMEACLEAVQRDAERLEPRYRYEFDQLKQSVPDRPIFADIEVLLQKKMFSVAHDYMQRVLREDAWESPEGGTLQMSEERDALRRFLREYGPLSRLCTDERGQSRTLEHIYNTFAGDANQDKNRTKRSARQMIRSWPRNNNPSPESIRDLLHCLSLPARQVRYEGSAGFRAEFDPPATNVYTYPHPIAAFGTRLAQTGLNVRVLSGRKTAGELVDLINGLGHTDTPTLFLLDYALPLSERNALAAKLKRESAHLSTCIVLDRVLMLFLTGCSDAERGKVLLQCTLPFHFYNPYVKGDTPMPPEMFMGRRSQLTDILNNGGANIIYGGRQLGKTALLRRAAGLADDRANGRWAVYTDVLCRCDYQESLKKLYAHLTAENFLKPEAEGPESWEELCELIRARMDRPGQRVERFLLLMDEADRFLETSGTCSYRPVECLHQLQTATGGRFKYVLAGLHNVMRFARSATRNNSVLAKLGTLTIKPLTYQEARELLEEPLYYLGFRLGADQGSELISQILLTTNYYPGLIHFYCTQLIESLGSGASGELRPPYQMGEEQIQLLLQKSDFISQIREKFFITLDVEEDKLYYRILAYALAYCYYDQPEGAVEGYTAQEIYNVCRDWQITAITELPPESVETLLTEMEELNVLMCLNGRYTFNGANFRHMMGDLDTVLNELDSFGGEEA